MSKIDYRSGFQEKDIENTVIELLEDKGYIHQRQHYDWLVNRKLDDFINEELFIESLLRFNNVKVDVIKEVLMTIKSLSSTNLFEKNQEFHRYLTDGISVDVYGEDVNPLIKLIDFETPNNNTFEVINQIKYKEFNSTRIPDIVIYINGMPIILFELKGIDSKEGTKLINAYNQIGGNSEADGYRYDIPTLFHYNAFSILSDGANSLVGTITSNFDRYIEWKSVDGEFGFGPTYAYKLQVLIDGLFPKERLLDVIKNNLFFMKKDKEKPTKIMSQYFQYFGVLKALDSINKKRKIDGIDVPERDGKAGLVWHTQGSGKSFSMVMLAQRLITNQIYNNPTIVVLTDRNDLDEQLFTTFSNSREYLRTTPVKVESREDLINKLSNIKQGGIFFTTIQKFDKSNIVPNDRSNIIVMADEAHRGHYGIFEKLSYQKDEDGDYELVAKYGIEKYIRDSLPNATFIGFTGTPVSTAEKQTTDIYGEIIDTYDMTQSIIDGSTVKIYYEGRLAKVWVDPNVLNQIDEYYDVLEETSQASVSNIQKSKSEMASLKQILESEGVINLLAKDIIEHYEGRNKFLNGKAMIIMPTRKSAMEIYHKILDLRPNYNDLLQVVVTESNKDTEEMRKLFGSSSDRQNYASDFKSDNSKIKIAIVVDMWLTGFDVPDLDVMYIFKKMKDHTLMQAIARVNRVYPGKENGLVVDYIGIRKALELALDKFTRRDKEFNLEDIKKTALVILEEKIDILDEWFNKIKVANFNSEKTSERFNVIQDGSSFILENETRKKEYLSVTRQLKTAYTICAGIIDDEVYLKTQYYLAVRAFIIKLEAGEIPINTVSVKEMNEYVASLLQLAIGGDEVKVLTQIKNEEDLGKIIDLLRPEKIEELRKSNPKHVFIKLIENLLSKVIAESRKNNLIKSQQYSEKLRRILDSYHSRTDDLSVEEVIVHLVDFAIEVVHDEDEATRQGLSGREKAFYDALATDRSARELLNDETLKLIAHELKEKIEEYATVDWSIKKSTQARMRIEIKRLLKKYNYPPDFTDGAIERVIKQAEYMM